MRLHVSLRALVLNVCSTGRGGAGRGMAMCNAPAQDAANGIRTSLSCSRLWRRRAGAWERVLGWDARTLRM